MIIIYDSGIATKDHLEARMATLRYACRHSKLRFKFTDKKSSTGYVIRAETKVDIFDTWPEMHNYIQQLVIRHNKQA